MRDTGRDERRERELKREGEITHGYKFQHCYVTTDPLVYYSSEKLTPFLSLFYSVCVRESIQAILNIFASFYCNLLS